jgi:hypothetical protein
MKLKWLLLLLLPFTLLAQTTKKSATHKKPATNKKVVVDKTPAQPTERFTFNFLIMDDFITTSPEKGGMVVYNYDTTGMSIDGEIEFNPGKKTIIITYAADKKNPMIAAIDGKPKYDLPSDSYAYLAHWTDTNEKTELTLTYNNINKTVKILFGPHKGSYANYWDRIYKFSVTKKS